MLQQSYIQEKVHLYNLIILLVLLKHWKKCSKNISIFIHAPMDKNGRVHIYTTRYLKL